MLYEFEQKLKHVNPLLYDSIYKYYWSDTCEFSSTHLNRRIWNISEISMLETYAALQKNINGDDVVRIENLCFNVDTRKITHGKILPLDNEKLYKTYTELETVNFRYFLQSLDGTGVYRVMDLVVDEEDNIVSGELVDFIL